MNSKLIYILFFLFSLPAFSQYQFKWTGSFTVHTLDTINNRFPAPVAFTLEWNELNHYMVGIYKDNYIDAPVEISGKSSVEGRNVFVQHPTLGAMNLTSSSSLASNGAVAVSISAQNNIFNILATMSSLPTSSFCSTGFGVLSGYCGIYTGSNNEMEDGDNLCNLVAFQPLMVEVMPNTDVNVVTNGNRQKIGSIPSSPLSGSMSISSHHCGAIQDTLMDPTHCQTETLLGEFTQAGDQHVFNGTFKIVDEANGSTCTYNLSLNQKVL
jgi:hypothetical protein